MSKPTASVFFVATLVFAANLCPAQHKKREKPSSATRAAGTEIPWQPSLEAAFEAARAQKRPVFWYVPTVAGSRMDRKPEIDLYMMSGPFASEEVGLLLSRKFIPVKAVASGEWQAKYELKPLAFVEPGFLILAPDGVELARLDKITTFNNDWIRWQIRQALMKRPELDLPSAEGAKAQTESEVAPLARVLLEEGDAAAALSALGSPEAGEAAGAAYLRGCALVGLRKSAQARAVLSPLAAGKGETAILASVELARLFLREEKYAEAAAAFAPLAKVESARAHEARFLHAVSLRHSGKDAEAMKELKELALVEPGSRWTRKASAEAQRLGPFSRCFERFDWIPLDSFVAPADGTCRPRTEKDAAWLARRSVDLLLMTQKADGSWDDSNYDFGGTDSLPNVYAAGTALAALALLEWRALDATRIDAAVKLALSYLSDEERLANDDKDEIVWAHAYRLLLWDAVSRTPGPEADAARKKSIEVVQRLLASQAENGSWRHEYFNPFATATVVHALGAAAARKVPVNREAMANASRLLAKCRGDDGSFSYGNDGRGQKAPFSSGRSPICELALSLAGGSDDAKLATAVQLSLDNHRYLERVRKYDDHSDEFGNGGFFFWYGMFGRTEAINALKDSAQRSAFRQQQRALVLQIAEIDGGFVDSHELGKTYGTAMGLISLKRTEEGAQ